MGIDGSQAAVHSLRWWQTIKDRKVIGTGSLMSAAYMLPLIFLEYGAWDFIAAVAIGVLPFARKAFALASAGSPFPIEMLMSVAALGALIIGEPEEVNRPGYIGGKFILLITPCCADLRPRR